MKSFWRYLGGTAFKPRSTFRTLTEDPRQVSKSFKAVLFIGILYTLTVVGFAASGALIAAPAFLALEPENYYFWEIFFAMPVYILGWILAAGFMQLISRWGKGSGTFEKSFATLGFAITVPSFITWIPETAAVILMLTGMTQEELVDIVSQPGFWQTFMLAYQLVAIFWMFILFSVAAGVSQKMRWWRAILIGLLTTVVFMGMMLVFIR